MANGIINRPPKKVAGGIGRNRQMLLSGVPNWGYEVTDLTRTNGVRDKFAQIRANELGGGWPSGDLTLRLRNILLRRAGINPHDSSLRDG